MKIKGMSILKGVIAIAGLVLPLIESQLSKKELDETVSKKVAEALQSKAGES